MIINETLKHVATATCFVCLLKMRKNTKLETWKVDAYLVPVNGNLKFETQG